MKTPRVEDFDPNAKKLPDMGMESLPRIEKAALTTPLPPSPDDKASQEALKPVGTTTIPRHHDTTTPRYHDTLLANLRKAVKEIGKEAATHRFTVSEKRAIADIIYTYKRQGIETSENEIARISINFILRDFREYGEISVLAKVLTLLYE
jgi:hypothetical protein